jgi:lipid-binding SYLF domain-containing protein
MKYFKLLATSVLALCATASLPSSGRAASAAEISQSAKAALRSLYANNPAAELVGKRAKAVLVFPSIIKGGFIVGAQHGDGALLSGGSRLL